MKKCFVFIIILVVINGFAQQKKSVYSVEYLSIDTIKVEGYCIRQYHKEDVHILQEKEGVRPRPNGVRRDIIDYGPYIKYMFTTHLDGRETMEANNIYHFIDPEKYDNLECYLFPPVSSEAKERLPEMASCQDTVRFPKLSFYKLKGDDKHLFTIYKVKGIAERYCVKTNPLLPTGVDLGWDTGFAPCLTARVPYVYLYFFRWPEQVSIITDVDLEGFKLYWKRE